jgi:hypothetical protein
MKYAVRIQHPDGVYVYRMRSQDLSSIYPASDEYVDVPGLIWNTEDIDLANLIVACSGGEVVEYDPGNPTVNGTEILPPIPVGV